MFTRRPKAKPERITVSENLSYQAQIPPAEGGGYVFLHQIGPDRYWVHIKDPNVRFECSFSELEALAQLTKRMGDL